MSATATATRLQLGSVLRIKHGYAFPGDEFSDDPAYPTLVTPGNFAIGGGFKEGKPKTFVGGFPDEYELAPGDLIVTMTDLSKDGDTLGLPAVVPEGRRYLHNQRIGLVEITDPESADADFLSYYLRTPAYRSYVLGTASGSTVRHTSPTKIAGFYALLPYLDEQRAIAEVLGALDDKIAANARAAETADLLAKLIYSNAADEVPTMPMSAAITPVLGGTPPRDRPDLWDGQTPWASARDITGASRGVLLATAESISADAAEIPRYRPMPAGSVIITARGTVGAVARLGRAASFNQSCYGFAPDTLPAGLLYFGVLRATEQAKAMAHGSVFDTITTKTFDHLLIPQFSAGQAAELERKLAPLLDVITQLMIETDRLGATRDTLLPELMSGRLRVRDAQSVVEAAL